MGLTRDTALGIAGMSKHQYYHKPKLKKKKRGMKPSKDTIKMENNGPTLVSNMQVCEQIKEVHKDPDLRYGYIRMTYDLKIKGYQINKKKVYRLMKKLGLLRMKHKPQKTYAKYRILLPEQPLTMLEMDIKMVWLASERKHSYILTVIDIFTRVVLGWHVGISIKQDSVKALWSEIIINHLQPHDMLRKRIDIEVRNDNDSRFCAKSVQVFFANNYINQVFTHPYTPQENGHIEAFHSIIAPSLDRQVFETIDHLENYLTTFYFKYNHIRVHGSIAGLQPFKFWEQWEEGNILRSVRSDKKVSFKLKIPYFQISGNENLREASCSNMDTLDGWTDSDYIKTSAGHENQSSVQRSLSVASC